MILLTPLVGYLLGALPTANGIARLWGVDLRAGGSGNPGANNARRLGGYPLATIVLLVEMGKGLLAVVVGSLLAGDLGATLAGIGAVAGNVYNPFYRFRGGKGLGMSAGVITGLWPPALPILLAVLIVTLLITRSSGQATLVALGAAFVLSVVWTLLEWPNAWGVESDGGALVLFGFGLTLFMSSRHLFDARNPISESSGL